MQRRIDTNHKKVVVLKGRCLWMLQRILAQKSMMFWHNLTRREKYHCNRLVAFSLIELKPYKINVDNINKTCYHVIGKENAEYKVNDDDETIKIGKVDEKYFKPKTHGLRV